MTTDPGDSAILVILDLTAALDTGDHIILLSHLERSVGVRVLPSSGLNSICLEDETLPLPLPLPLKQLDQGSLASLLKCLTGF